MALLKFIFIVILILFVINVTFRYVVPYLLKRFLNKKMREFSNEQHKEDHNHQQDTGKVTVVTSKSKKRPTFINNDEGEYVDYKEVKED